MLIAKISGIPIRVNGYLLLLIFLFAAAGMGIKVLLIFLSILWHEFSHSIAATFFGLKVREIELLPFGGVARVDGLHSIGNTGEMVIAAAGPLSSLSLAAFFYFIPPITGQHELWFFLFRSNLLLAAFNLLPALPLDGGRMVRSWLCGYTGYKKATSLVVGSSYLISLLLVIGSLYDFWQMGRLNISAFMAAGFLYIASREELKVARFRTMSILAEKKAKLMKAGLMPASHITIFASTKVRELLPMIIPESYCILLVVDKECRLCATLTETQLWEGVQKKGLYMAIGDFL